LLGSLLRVSYDGILITDAADQSVLDGSQSLLDLTGYRRELVLGRTPLELNLFEPRVWLAAVNGARREAAAGRFETRLRRQDGRTRWVEFSTHPVFGGHRLLTVVHDVTRHKTLEAHLREAFGAYVDDNIAELILSGQLPHDGIEVTASLMFVDARDFTGFAAGADAKCVVVALNRLFEVIVPIVRAHGGLVDKFLGDGLLAVFGTPEAYPDHADRAVAAGQEIVTAVNQPRAVLRVGVGINTGRVVAGSIGGAGRLNFSVVGHPVNVCDRVQAATRDTGDDLLLTSDTRAALTRPIPLRHRGSVALRGKVPPTEIWTPDPVRSDSPRG
jgi:PAS domain S-box-containing protein